jgi:putative tryptophan/tyrosine transport system substrate-binding protein
MRKRTFLLTGMSMALLPRSLAAQDGTGVKRIGWLTAQRPASLTPYLDAFRSGLSDLGYKETGNLHIEYRYGEDDIGRVPELAESLLRVPVALIVAQGAAVSAVRKLGISVPVIYVFSADPVSAGFAENLSRPTGNMTGITFMAAEMNGKRLEILCEFVPDLKHVALIANPEHAGEQLERAYCEEVAGRLGLSLSYFPTRTTPDLTAAFDSIASGPARGLCVFADGFAVQNRGRIIEFATSQRIPVVSGWRVFAESGAICTYGPRLTESYRRLASYVDRILKGSKPSDLPIEQPTTFETIVNRRTANALGLTIPPTLLARADEVIE